MSKYFRSVYFKYNPEVKRVRHEMGCERFDEMYRSLYKFLSSLHIGQYFQVSKLCRNNPENHDLVVLMCDIYHNMDFNVNLEWDEERDIITVLPTQDGRTRGPYCPPDIYSKIVASPKEWGVDADDL